MTIPKKILRPDFQKQAEDLSRGRLGKSSGTYVKTLREWTADDDAAFRSEIETRYRERTPPITPRYRDAMSRVSREEMEDWAIKVLYKPLPQTDEWALDFVTWYQKMMKQNQVHANWLQGALCGFRGRKPAILTSEEASITCDICREIFREPDPNAN